MKKSELRQIIREIISEQTTIDCVSDSNFLFAAAFGLDGEPNIAAITSACQQLGNIPDQSQINDFTESCCEEVLGGGDNAPSTPTVGATDTVAQQSTADGWWAGLPPKEKDKIFSKFNRKLNEAEYTDEWFNDYCQQQGYDYYVVGSYNENAGTIRCAAAVGGEGQVDVVNVDGHIVTNKIDRNIPNYRNNNINKKNTKIRFKENYVHKRTNRRSRKG